MNIQLQAVISELRAADDRLRTLQSRLTTDVWLRRPGRGQWSPSECVAHLNLASEALLPLLRAGLQQAREDRLHPPEKRYRRDPFGWLIWAVIPPSGGLRTQAIPAFVPSGNTPPEALLADFTRLQSELVDCVLAAEGLAIDQVKLVSPFDARVKYNLYAALTLVPRHQHRHLLQAERAADVVAVGVPALAG